MPGKSDYLATAVLRHLARNTGLAVPATVYVSLHTATLNKNGTGAEVSGGGYARVACSTGASGTGSGAVFGAPAANGANQRVSNASAITFPSPTANWGTVTDFGIWDAASGGNLLYAGTLATSRTINNGDQAPAFAIGSLTVDEG